MMRLLFFLACFAVLLASGCVSINESDPNSALPSNRPANWEGKSLGVPL